MNERDEFLRDRLRPEPPSAPPSPGAPLPPPPAPPRQQPAAPAPPRQQLAARPAPPRRPAPPPAAPRTAVPLGNWGGAAAAPALSAQAADRGWRRIVGLLTF